MSRSILAGGRGLMLYVCYGHTAAAWNTGKPETSSMIVEPSEDSMPKEAKYVQVQLFPDAITHTNTKNDPRRVTRNVKTSHH
jgi:hypothetical protein